MRVRILALVAAALLIGSTLPSPSSAKPRAKSSAKSSAKAAKTPDVGAVARKMALEIQASVSKVRGLPIRRKLKVGVYSAAQLRAFVQKELTHGKAGERLDATSEALRLMGMAKPGYELRRGMIELLEEQVAGLYDPASKQLKLMRRLVATKPPSPLRKLILGDPRDETRVVMAHEIVHALQDQRFNLRRLARERPHNGDLEFALSALIEGDATVAMMGWMLEDRGSGTAMQLFAANEGLSSMLRVVMRFARVGLLPDTAALARSPRWLQDRLAAPYVEGLQLCLHVGRGIGFPAVDALFLRPPLSSEQVLHPAKLLAKTPDLPIVLKARWRRVAKGTGWRVRWHDLWGEMGARSLFYELSTEQEAEQAAAGWGGDRWWLLRRKKRTALVWMAVWDSAADAAQAEAMGRKWVRKAPAAGPKRQAIRAGLDTVWSVGLGGSEFAKIAAKLTKSVRRTPLKRVPR